MDLNKYMDMVQIFDAEALLASGTATSAAVDLSKASSGLVGVQYTVAGSGTVKIEALESINGSDYVTNGTAVATSLTVGTGLDSHDAAANRSVKFKITETGTTDAAAVSLWVSVR